MEIGSEIQLNLSDYNEIVSDNIFNYLSDYNTIYLDSGRSALKVLDKSLEEGSVLLPSYICKSVIDSFADREINFYSINTNFTINEDYLITTIREFKPKILLIVNYWGKIYNSRFISKLKKNCEENEVIIVEDITHSIFTIPNSIGDYCVCSLRKWFPVARGGILMCNKNVTLPIKITIKTGAEEEKFTGLMLKQLYIDRKISEEANHIYREIFSKDAKSLKEQKEVFYLPSFSKFIMERCSISQIKKRRYENYSYLLNALQGIDSINNIVDFSENEVPFVFPLYVENRDEFRNYLASNEIYCAVHWPLEDERQFTDSNRNINQHIISLNIDQRYEKKDMKRIADVIYSFHAKGFEK